MYKGFKVRIYPTEQQEKLLNYYCYSRRKMWNHVVEKFKDEKNIVGKYGMKNYRPRQLLNEIEEVFGLSGIPERIALEVLVAYSQSWQLYYLHPDKFGIPKFHKYNSKKQSFRIISQTFPVFEEGIKIAQPHKNKTVKLDNIFIPINKKFLLKFPIEKIIDPVYKIINGKWYLSGTYAIEKSDVKQSDNWLGLDWGIKNFYTDNNGNFYNYPSSVVQQYQRIKTLQSYADKKNRGSNNFYKAQNRLSKSFERLENLKRDYIEKTTSILSNNNIVVEDLTNSIIKHSTRRRRRIQMIMPRTRFNQRLKDKCNMKNNAFIEVSPYYTTRTCSKCGIIKDKMPTDIRIFECECGYIEDRDINASINILARGVC